MAAILYLFFFTIIFDDASLPKKQFGFFHLSLEVSINKKLKICLKYIQLQLWCNKKISLSKFLSNPLVKNNDTK